jgi:hypothetical protein
VVSARGVQLMLEHVSEATRNAPSRVSSASIEKGRAGLRRYVLCRELPSAGGIRIESLIPKRETLEDIFVRKAL